MPYDDSNLKKMIKDQKERKVGFSKSRRVSDEAKNLIHSILEAQTSKRATLKSIREHPWLSRFAEVKPPITPESEPTTSLAYVANVPEKSSKEQPEEKNSEQDSPVAKETEKNTSYDGVVITDFVEELKRKMS